MANRVLDLEDFFHKYYWVQAYDGVYVGASGLDPSYMVVNHAAYDDYDSFYTFPAADINRLATRKNALDFGFTTTTPPG